MGILNKLKNKMKKWTKKEKLMFASGITLLVSLILFFVLTGWYVLGLVFLAVSCVGAVIMELKKRFETRCSKCKKAYDYESEVSWKLIKEFTKEASSANKTLGQLMYQFEFVCECSECGTKKRYLKNIEAASITDKGEMVTQNYEAIIEAAFVKKEATWRDAVITSAFCFGASVILLAAGLFLGLA